MAITINGTGTITGISQGGLPDDVITAADIKDSDYQAPLVAGTDYQAPLVAGTDYLAPNGDGSGLTGISSGGKSPEVLLNYESMSTIAASQGVSSVSYSSGVTTVYFSTSFANTKYYLIGNYSTSGTGDFQGLGSYNQATNYVEVQTVYVTGTNSAASNHNVNQFYFSAWST